MKLKSEQNGNILEVLQGEIERKLAQSFPALYGKEIRVVDPKLTRLGIDDISYRAQEPIDEALEFLFVSCRGEICCFDVRRQTEMLVDKMARLTEVANPKKTIIIFPGNGAGVIKDLLPNSVVRSIPVVSVPTRRIVNPNTKAVEGVKIEEVSKARRIIADSKINTFIVIDDAVVTGSTLQAIREAFPVRGSEWYAGTLFMLSPIQNRNKERAKGPSGVDGFKSIIASTIYQGTSGIPALNSLSTLIGSSERSEAVRTRYVRDFVEDPEIFGQMIERLQQSVSLNGL